MLSIVMEKNMKGFLRIDIKLMSASNKCSREVPQGCRLLLKLSYEEENSMY